MGMLIAGLALFLGAHSVTLINEPWRNRMAARLGEWRWKGLYALVSLIGLALTIRGYAVARDAVAVLYTPPIGLRHTAMTLMLPFFPLLFAAYLPGRLRRVTGHPMLAATILWAGSHLLANGSLADVLLFGAILVWAVVERLSLRRRTQRPLPLAPASRYNDLIAVIAGLTLHMAFIVGLHAWLFGKSPI